NGSTTNACLPLVGPRVFNSTIAADPAGSGPWYDAVKALPSDIAWRAAYAATFGAPAPDYADTYYDAAALLLKTLTKVSHPGKQTRVIGRGDLAATIRSTSSYCGVPGLVALGADGYRTPDVVACAG